jgi:hypothetical protein
VHHIPVKRGVSPKTIIHILRNAVMPTDLVEQLIDDAFTERVNGNRHFLPTLTAQFEERGHGSQNRIAVQRGNLCRVR